MLFRPLPLQPYAAACPRLGTAGLIPSSDPLHGLVPQPRTPGSSCPGLILTHAARFFSSSNFTLNVTSPEQPCHPPTKMRYHHPMDFLFTAPSFLLFATLPCAHGYLAICLFSCLLSVLLHQAASSRTMPVCKGYSILVC